MYTGASANLPPLKLFLTFPRVVFCWNDILIPDDLQAHPLKSAKQTSHTHQPSQ